MIILATYLMGFIINYILLTDKDKIYGNRFRLIASIIWPLIDLLVLCEYITAFIKSLFSF